MGTAGYSYGSALPQPIIPTASPFGENSKGFTVFRYPFSVFVFFFPVGTGCDKGAFPKTDKLLLETIMRHRLVLRVLCLGLSL